VMDEFPMRHVQKNQFWSVSMLDNANCFRLSLVGWSQFCQSFHVEQLPRPPEPPPRVPSHLLPDPTPLTQYPQSLKASDHSPAVVTPNVDHDVFTLPAQSVQGLVVCCASGVRSGSPKQKYGWVSIAMRSRPGRKLLQVERLWKPSCMER